jgi:hypothetical protein
LHWSCVMKSKSERIPWSFAKTISNRLLKSQNGVSEHHCSGKIHLQQETHTRHTFLVMARRRCKTRARHTTPILATTLLSLTPPHRTLRSAHASLSNLWEPEPRTRCGGASWSWRQRVASRTNRGRAVASFCRCGPARGGAYEHGGCWGWAGWLSMGLLGAGGVAEHGCERRQRRHRYPVSGVCWRRKCSSDANLRAQRPITAFGSPPRLKTA